MHRTAVQEALRDWIERPTTQQLDLLSALGSIYERQGVVRDGHAHALCDACPDAPICWAGAEDRISRNATIEGHGDDGSVFFPYVGRRYEPGSVCLIGWNLHHSGDEWWGLQEEFVIADEDRDRLGQGHHISRWNSWFAYRSLSAGLAIADSIDGAVPVAEPDPRQLATGMDRLARLQTVKCAPLGERSNPQPAMNLRCPPRYLVQELAILRPAAVVIFGDHALNAAADAIETLAQDAWIDWRPKFRDGYARGTLEDGDWPLTVFGLWHPTYSGWPKCQQRLVSDLVDRPLT